MGVMDQRPVEARADVLVYASAVVTDALEVTGPVVVTLHAARAPRLNVHEWMWVPPPPLPGERGSR